LRSLRARIKGGIGGKNCLKKKIETPQGQDKKWRGPGNKELKEQAELKGGNGRRK